MGAEQISELEAQRTTLGEDHYSQGGGKDHTTELKNLTNQIAALKKQQQSTAGTRSNNSKPKKVSVTGCQPNNADRAEADRAEAERLDFEAKQAQYLKDMAG